MKQSQAKGWALLSPTIIILVLVGVIPFFYVICYSVLKYSVYAKPGKNLRFIGLDNFRKLVFDSDLMAALGRGLVFTISTCALELILGLGLAILLTYNFWGKGIFRTVLTLPLAVAPITIGSIWVLMTNLDMGPIPYFFKQLGINYNIGESGIQAFWTTVAMDVWHWTPFVALTLLAGLTTFPKEPFESAQVDGATRFQVFRYLTLPLLTPVIVTTLFIRIMDTLRIFDEVWMLTSGGPGTATRYASIHVARMTIRQKNYGYGASMSIFFLYLTVVICWLLLNIVQKVRNETEL
ncbi:ABC transporter substrate-binding protein [candidate division KSB3 bacterium]|uniref:ABC transporter substrate-binding protein n=1 Tax=candidate division KSB3 bacterium TaxID=2044937 RepID=A0A2G6K928_9BACT|nr:MAG: ABC transporter substrate-binding protein [candidate division KSB3 bacterium]